MKSQIVIFGTDDQARLAYVHFSQDSEYEVAAFTAHRRFINSDRLFGLDTVPFEELTEYYPPDRYGMFVALSYREVNHLRTRIYLECKQLGYQMVSYISSSSQQWGEISFGEHCFVSAKSNIDPFASIGNNVFIGAGVLIGHNTVIGDHCFLAMGAVIPGRVQIGPYCIIGANATIRNGITIAAECIIGPGATVMKDTKRGEVYLGTASSPAPINSHAMSHFYTVPRPKSMRPADDSAHAKPATE